MFALVGCAEGGGPVELPPLPDRISSLPLGIRVVPESGPIVHAVYTGEPSLEYEWPRTLYVFVEDTPVRIVEFGVFAWIDGEWVAADPEGEPRTGEDFARWMRCDGALLERGQVFRSSLFTTAGNVLPSTSAVQRWYFIGEGEEGYVRGEVTVTNLPPLERG